MTVILIPGFMLDRELWADIEDELAFLGPLIHSDPGSGDSFQDMAQTTLQMAPQSFVLVGFSMGGYIAREIARMAPTQVSHLILIATSSRKDNRIQESHRSQMVHGTSGSFGGVSRRAIRQALSPSREGDVDLLERIHAMSARLGRDTLRKQASMSRDGDAERLAEIQCPTLIVAGRFDRLRSLEEATELCIGIPGAKLVILESGHMIPMEAPHELASVIVDFVRPKP